jgi:hypothetical protein
VGNAAGNVTASINEDVQWYKVPNYTDKFNYGWFGRSQNSASLAQISYLLSFDKPGAYELTLGIKDWWPPTGKTQNRQYTVTVSDTHGVIATLDGGLLSPEGEGPQDTVTLPFTLANSGNVTVTVANRVDEGTDDPVLSWFAVTKKKGIFAYVTDAVRNDSSLSVDMLVQNFGGAARKASVILAVYDGDGRLAATDSGEAPLGADGEAAVALEVGIEGLSGKRDYAGRVFVWDGDTFEPLDGVFAIDLSISE